MSIPRKSGTEFPIGLSSAGIQYEPAVTALTNGQFVVAWTDQDGAGDYNVRAQIFNADGTSAGPAFPVNSTAGEFQGDPDVTVLSGGRFVVSWTDSSESGSDTTGLAVRAQIFNSNGSKSGAEFLVNTIATGSQFMPVITGLHDGRFMVTYRDASLPADPDGMAIRAQLFDGDGSKSGPELFIDTAYYNPGSAQHAAAALSGGKFVLAWADSVPAGDGTYDIDIRAQVFNADGSEAGAGFLVNTITGGRQSTPTMTTLADGRFVVTWHDFSNSTGYPADISIRGQAFNADGSKSGNEFFVNETTSWQTAPVTALPDGRFVVTWTEREEWSSPDIHAQVFNGDGSKSGAEFTVNTATERFQGDPDISVLADGRFAITWSDYSAMSRDPVDRRNGIIRGQIFDPRLAALHIIGTVAGDDYMGTRFDDVMLGSGGNDRLAGAAGSDELHGQRGHDSLFGGAGDDELRGGAGNDRLDGGAGDDALIGGAGNDLFIIDTAGDCIIEQSGGGNDAVHSAVMSLGLLHFAGVENASLLGNKALDLTGSDDDNVLTGNNAANVIRGLGGDDTLIGRGGNDVLIGGAGRDKLDGGRGDDILTGGSGKDIFVFSASHGRDRVTDFRGGADRIDLSSFGFSSANEATSFAADTSTGVVFNFAPGNVLTLEHISMAQLSEVDFIL
jgi:Ca2+-binding RTX toxin-like protein